MPYFLSPKVLFGSGMLKRLGSEIEGKGNKAALITDKVMSSTSSQVVDLIKTAGYEVKIWDGANQEPSVDQVVECSKFLLQFGP